MTNFQLKVFGNGLLVNARKISAQKARFWGKRKTTELTRYLFDGHESFDEFKVPKSSVFSGVLAEDEEDLEVLWSHESPFSEFSFKQIYGPKIEAIDRIECVDISKGGDLIWAIDHPQVKPHCLPNDPDEEDTVFLKIAKDNLIILESERGCWVYESTGEFREPFQGGDELKAIISNCSFGGKLDSIIDGTCLGMVLSETLFVLADSDTETQGLFATIYQDDL